MCRKPKIKPKKVVPPSSPEETVGVKIDFPKFNQDKLIPQFAFDFLNSVPSNERVGALFRHLAERGVQIEKQRHETVYYSESDEESSINSDPN